MYSLKAKPCNPSRALRLGAIETRARNTETLIKRFFSFFLFNLSLARTWKGASMESRQSKLYLSRLHYIPLWAASQLWQSCCSPGDDACTISPDTYNVSVFSTSDDFSNALRIKSLHSCWRRICKGVIWLWNFSCGITFEPFLFSFYVRSIVVKE